MRQILFFFLLLSFHLPLLRAETDGHPLEILMNQSTLTGNWGGIRSKLEEKGIKFTSLYYADFLGNPIGGREKGFRYTGSWEGDLDIDAEKLLSWKGTKFHLSFIWGMGKSLSQNDIGNQFEVSNVFIGDSFWLWELYWEQSFFEDVINIRIGRLAAEEDFAFSPLYDNFVSAIIDDIPITFTLNEPGFSSQPAAYWGVRTKVKPNEKFYVMGGIYNSDPKVAQPDLHGVDFKLNPNDGVFMIFETGYLLHQGKNDTGLPGNYKFGSYVDTARFGKFIDEGDIPPGGLPPEQGFRRGNYGFYFLIDQMIYREPGPDKTQGLTPMAVFTMAPDRKVNAMPWLFFVGASYKGLIPQRDRDIASVGFGKGWFSSKLPAQNSEMMVEATYQIQLTPWFYIQPDFQYIFNPNGTNNIKDAMVIGFEVGVVV